jgi:hypothetical protein
MLKTLFFSVEADEKKPFSSTFFSRATQRDVVEVVDCRTAVEL